MQNPSARKAQRNWRYKIISELKHKLGNHCQRCEGPDAAQLAERPFLNLVIPNRRAENLLKYANNTIMIYNHVLKGKLSEDVVTLLCPDCKFEYKADTDVKDPEIDS